MTTSTRIWYDRPDLMRWSAVAVMSSGGVVQLDRTAFYPGGGGQPADAGALAWVGGSCTVNAFQSNGEPLLRIPQGIAAPPVGTHVSCALDADRRVLTMRTHTALHVLSAIMSRDFSAPVTGSDMQPGSARMDFAVSVVPQGFRDTIQRRLSDEVAADHAVTIEYIDPADFDTRTMTRTAESLVPKGLEKIRLIRIGHLDLQADGGTHVSSTSQIGAVTITKIENKGAGHRGVRITLGEQP